MSLARTEAAVKAGLMKADENGHYVAVKQKAPKKKEEPKLKVVGDMPAKKKEEDK